MAAEATDGRLVVVIPSCLGARARAAEQLLGRLLRALPGAVVMVSPTTGNSRQDVAAAVSLGLAARCEWVLYVEDDAWPAPRLGARLAPLMAPDATPRHDAVCLFSRRAAHLARGLHRSREIPTTVGVLLRSAAVTDFPAWAPGWYERHPEHVHASDLVLTDYLRASGAPMAVASPSLFQHRAGPSTFKGRSTKRFSRSFLEDFGPVPPLPSAKVAGR